MDYHYKLPDSPQKLHIIEYLRQRISECRNTARLYSGIETTENIIKREKAQAMTDAYADILRMIE